jgi:hypothetical protein
VKSDGMLGVFSVQSQDLLLDVMYGMRERQELRMTSGFYGIAFTEIERWLGRGNQS